VVFYGRFFSPEGTWNHGLSFWKPALGAGAAFTLPAYLAAVFLGPEFPSLIGASVGLLLALYVLRRPRERGKSLPNGAMSFPRAIVPYSLLGGMLVLTRLHALPLRDWLQSFTLSFRDILGTDIGATVSPLYLPGTLFLAVSLVAFRLYGFDGARVRSAMLPSLARLGPSAIALGAALPMVRIFIHSGENAIGLGSMPLEMASHGAAMVGGYWPLIAPLVGALGSFLSGSATFSNLMFADLQVLAAGRAGAPPELILALQTLGASAGNMISVLNVVAAAAVVGLSGKEGAVIRFSLLPMLCFCALTGLLGLALVCLSSR
jgi:lactate permease